MEMLLPSKWLLERNEETQSANGFAISRQELISVRQSSHMVLLNHVESCHR